MKIYSCLDEELSTLSVVISFVLVSLLFSVFFSEFDWFFNVCNCCSTSLSASAVCGPRTNNLKKNVNFKKCMNDWNGKIDVHCSFHMSRLRKHIKCFGKNRAKRFACENWKKKLNFEIVKINFLNFENKPAKFFVSGLTNAGKSRTNAS